MKRPEVDFEYRHDRSLSFNRARAAEDLLDKMGDLTLLDLTWYALEVGIILGTESSKEAVKK